MHDGPHLFDDSIATHTGDGVSPSGTGSTGDQYGVEPGDICQMDQVKHAQGFGGERLRRTECVLGVLGSSR